MRCTRRLLVVAGLLMVALYLLGPGADDAVRTCLDGLASGADRLGWLWRVPRIGW